MKNILFIAAILMLFSCKDDDENNTEAIIPNTVGASFAASTNSFSETYTTLLTALEANENISIIAEVDHTANAQSVGRELRNTRVVLFGNPRLGTPVMALNQQSGLDLPQKILVYEDETGSVLVSYNSTDYVVARHGVELAESLAQISNALSNFTIIATGGTVIKRPATGIALNQGVITIQSQSDFATTYNRLRSSIENNDNLSMFAQVNHQQNAIAVGLELLPTSLIVFGNPLLGTPLMKGSKTAALDLPQKMLVWENSDGAVMISYNDPSFLKSRHAITDANVVLTQITTALKSLAEGAASL